jgi:hypothetical protein
MGHTSYGVLETNGLEDFLLASGYETWDAFLKDAYSRPPVSWSEGQLPRRGWQKEIVAHAQRDGVYAKGLGILDPLVVSTLV